MLKILIEGPDGTGKSSLQNKLGYMFENEGYKLVDSIRELKINKPTSIEESKRIYSHIRDLCKDWLYKGHPVVLLTAEPSYNHIGNYIREVLAREVLSKRIDIKNTLRMFAEDRYLQNHELIFPLEDNYRHKEGNRIILLQERSFLSMVYQLAQAESIKEARDMLRYAFSLKANKEALEHMFDDIIILDSPIDVIAERLSKRGKESEWEDTEFLKKTKRYYSWLSKGLDYFFERFNLDPEELNLKLGSVDIKKKINSRKTNLDKLARDIFYFIDHRVFKKVHPLHVPH